MPKSIIVRVKHDAPKGGAKSRKRYSRPRGFPSSRFGAVYVPRGTPEGIAKYGNTWREATAEQQLARKASGYYGRGLYTGHGGFWSDLWKNTAGVRGAVGDWARSQGGVTGALGTLSGAVGLGDYTTGAATTTNDIVDGGTGSPVPVFSSGPNEVVISHREYISDVFGPEMAGTFQNQTFPLNPAIVTTFPWLSQVACNYDEYEFGQLMFTFKSTVTDFVANNGQVGSIIMTTQYNPNETPFESKQDMMEYDGAVSGKVSGHIIAGVECDPSKNSGSFGKYTRSGPVPPGEDVKTYDLGALNVAVSNTPAAFDNQSLGELWVSYTVKLRKPKFFVTRGLSLLTDIWVGEAGGSGNSIGAFDSLGYGQQNRIGGQLVKTWTSPGTTNLYPVANNKLYYVFPATFSGHVTVTCMSTVQTTGRGLDLNYAPGYTLGGPGGVSMNPIFDIWENGQWTSKIDSADTVTDNGISTMTWHINIVSPTTAQTTGAQDNVLILTSTALLKSFQLSISVYNTGMNQSSAGHPLVNNPVTDLVEAWP